MVNWTITGCDDPFLIKASSPEMREDDMLKAFFEMAFNTLRQKGQLPPRRIVISPCTQANPEEFVWRV